MFHGKKCACIQCRSLYGQEQPVNAFGEAAEKLKEQSKPPIVTCPVCGHKQRLVENNCFECGMLLV
jgi:hypothetical protein